jgi:ribonuclease D
MVGLDYPSSYGKLINRMLGITLEKHETRTDWRKRPLSASQLEYALQDVIHLPKLYEFLNNKLQTYDRTAWLRQETETWMSDVIATETRERWRRVAGLSKLPYKSHVVAKELWKWREEEAQRRDVHPKRVLRDDLLIELARRGKIKVDQMREIRGMHRRDLDPHLPAIADRIRAAKSMKLAREPRQRKPVLPPHVDMLTQFLGAALTSVCRRQSIAPNLVGTAQDVRELIARHLGCDSPEQGSETPKLEVGWRSEIIGQHIHDLLDGKLALRITDPTGPAPLTFEGGDIGPHA